MSAAAGTGGALDPGQVTLIVIAKEPVPGRVKTRLAPELGEDGAAELAAAALADTLATVAETPAGPRLLALDGSPGRWLPEGFDIVPQRGDGLGERLAAAFADAGGPSVLVGMDTPQLTPALVADAVAELCRDDIEAVIGLAADGGWWTLGLRRPDPAVFDGVPMSEPDTGAAQIAALERLGLSYSRLPVLRDVDTIDDALAVAAEAPDSRFARALSKLAQPLWSLE
jgi:rSAM/selenodomain-associated transferase 1